MLQNTDGECAYSIVGRYTGTIIVVHRHAAVGIGDVFHNGIELQPWIIGLEIRCCLAFEKVIETTRIPDIVVLIAVLVECRVVASDSKDETGVVRCVRSLPIPFPFAQISSDSETG